MISALWIYLALSLGACIGYGVACLLMVNREREREYRATVGAVEAVLKEIQPG